MEKEMTLDKLIEICEQQENWAKATAMHSKFDNGYATAFGLCKNFSKELKQAGYRKQSDTIREFAEKVMGRLTERLDNAKGLNKEFKGTEAGLTYSAEAVGYDKAILVIKYLATEYGVEVE